MIGQQCNHLEFGQKDIGIHMSATSDVAMIVIRNLEKPSQIGGMTNIRKSRLLKILSAHG